MLLREVKMFLLFSAYRIEIFDVDNEFIKWSEANNQMENERLKFNKGCALVQ